MPGFRLPRLTLFPGFAALEKELPGIDVRSAPLVLRRIAVLALAHWGRLMVAAGCDRRNPSGDECPNRGSNEPQRESYK